ncbi:putative cutinase [Colletotrichum sublineola]|uniref:Putative cutinase n=1 Tax=Colletotrichum sublineola TaxID=1173701 RepID=A0A066XHU0_COLSU|nr:putative cutinase [Colletotrichum sublineola]
MRTSTAVAVAGFFTASASAQTATCATGVYVIAARGSNEPAGVGRIGTVARGVVAAIPGSQIEALDYPAAFDNYSSSVAAGTEAMKTALTQYNSRCPDSKVTLLGYSQGAQVVGDALCGNTEDDKSDNLDIDFSVTTPVAASVSSPSFSSGTQHTTPQPPGTGAPARATGIFFQLFPRENVTACESYAPKIESYCDKGDIYCDVGNDTTVHGSYFGNYTNVAVDFIVAQFNATKKPSANGTSPTTTPKPVSASGPAVPVPVTLMSLFGLSVLASHLL